MQIYHTKVVGSSPMKKIKQQLQINIIDSNEGAETLETSFTRLLVTSRSKIQKLALSWPWGNQIVKKRKNIDKKVAKDILKSCKLL